MLNTYTITYEVIVTCDSDVSLNNATDVVSLQLWHIDQDWDDIQVSGARLVHADNFVPTPDCGNCFDCGTFYDFGAGHDCPEADTPEVDDIIRNAEESEANR